MKYFRKLLAVLVLGAASLMTVTQAQAQEEHPAQKMVVDSITAMLDVLENDQDKIKSDPDYLQSKLEQYVIPDLDFDTMTKLAVGKFWRQADDNQQVELVEQFKTLLLNTYTGALTQYSGGSIKFDPFRPESRDDRAVVSSTFSEPGGNDVPVTYKLRGKDDSWFIYDIEVDAISLVTSYRSAFTNEIDKGGIAGLIETLKERNAKSES